MNPAPFVVVVVAEGAEERRIPADDENAARTTFAALCGGSGVLAVSVQRTTGPHEKRFVEGCEWSARLARQPVSTDELREIVSTCLADPSATIGARDVAIVLLTHAGILRADEIAALNIEEVAIHTSHITIEHAGRRLSLPAVDEIDVCPVRAMKRWLGLAGRGRGPLFGVFFGTRRLSADSIARTLTVRRAEAELRRKGGPRA